MNRNKRLFQIILFLSFFISNNSFSQKEQYIDTPFFDDFDAAKVNTSFWQVATWAEHGGKTSAERCYVEDGYLKMIFINDSDKGFLGSAIQSQKEFLYGKWEARIKPSNVSGILNSFYTIDWNNTVDGSSSSNGTKQEIDIELLTYSFSESTGQVHFAVHEQNKQTFQTNPAVSLDFNPSDDFHVWGFTITPEYIEWFVDDTPLKKYTYTDGEIAITAPYQLKLNAWTQENWINGPPVADVECEYLIDWIRFTPQSSTKAQNNQIQTEENQLQVYPNPCSNQATIAFSLKQSSNVNIRMHSIDGKLVYQNNLGFLNTGKHSMLLNNETLKTGLYFLSLNTGHSQENIQIEIIRS